MLFFLVGASVLVGLGTLVNSLKEEAPPKKGQVTIVVCDVKVPVVMVDGHPQGVLGGPGLSCPEAAPAATPEPKAAVNHRVDKDTVH